MDRHIFDTHPLGQSLIVTVGCVWVQCWDRLVEERKRPGTLRTRAIPMAARGQTAPLRPGTSSAQVGLDSEALQLEPLVATTGDNHAVTPRH